MDYLLQVDLQAQGLKEAKIATKKLKLLWKALKQSKPKATQLRI